MRSKRSLALLVLFAALGTTLLIPSPALSASSTGALRICTGCAAGGGDLSRFGYVILHAWEHGRIRDLKARNPHIKVLVYKNMSAAYEYGLEKGRDLRFLPAGVGYAYARQHRPDWFLLDRQGRRIEFADYEQLWLMDVGSPSYQRAWLANVAAELRVHGWDGVMIDDTNVSPGSHLEEGRTVAKYPNDSAYTGATRSFLARIGPALKAQGHLVLPNVYTEWPDGPAIWRDWLQFTSGAVLEYWTKWGGESAEHFAERDWVYRQQFFSITQQARKIFLGITYAPVGDVRSMRYARASFLLDWNGGPSAVVFEPRGKEPQPPFSREWTMDIGRPLGRRREVVGVLRRNYSRGVALANISSDSTRTIDLGRPYLAPDGERVSSVRLGPKSGVVLRAVGRSLSVHTGAARSADRHHTKRPAARLRKKRSRVR